MSLSLMLSLLSIVAVSPGWYFLILGLFQRSSETVARGYGYWAVGNWLSFVQCVLDSSHVMAALDGLAAAWMTWLWWKNRRKGRGRKALRELGDKSRRRIAALVEQMTPSPIPSPAGA